MDATTRRVPGGLPGQSDDWRSWNCWTTGLNDARDMIGVSLADEWMGLYLRSSEYQDTPRRAQRMLQYSRTIREQMGDQEFDGNEQSRSKKGRSVTVLAGLGPRRPRRMA